MKFVTYSLLAVLLIQASSAAPKPFIFDNLGNFAQGIGDHITGALEVGSNIAKNGINIATDVGSGITKGITGMYVNGLNSMQQISNNIRNAIKNSIDRFTNRVILRVVDQAKIKLADIEKRSERLLVVAEEKLDDAKQRINDNIQELQDNLNAWSDEQTRKGENSSDETQQQIQELLDNLSETSINDAQACADSILLPIEELHNQTKATIEQSFPLIDDLVNKIGECARLDQRNTRATSECAAEVKKKLEALSPLPGQYSKLLSQVNRVALNSLHRAPCVAETMENIEEQKRAVADQIDELVRKDKENQSSSTEAAEESTTEAAEDSTTEAAAESTTKAAEEPTTEAAEDSTTEEAEATTAQASE